MRSAASPNFSKWLRTLVALPPLLTLPSLPRLPRHTHPDAFFLKATAPSHPTA